MSANINKVEALALNQENKPWKQFTMKKSMMDWHIFGFSHHSVTVINLCVLAFHQMSSFNGKTHNLQTRQRDIIESKEYLTYTLMEY